MNESKQPFTDHVTRARNSTPAKLGWLIAILMTGAAVIVSILWNNANARQQKALQDLQSSLDQVKSDLASAHSENQSNIQAIADFTNQIADLQKQKEQALQSSKSLENEMRSELESKDVTISKLQGKLTVNILDRVLFDSGDAVLKPDGEAVMRKIASLLAEHPQLMINVVGHTDNVPIRPNAHSRFVSNWELSTARALAAVHFLTEQAGVDPRRVGAVGYGEFRPIADNATPEGRAKNRRIAITILPDEFNSAPETAPTTNSITSTNAPPTQ